MAGWNEKQLKFQKRREYAIALFCAWVYSTIHQYGKFQHAAAEDFHRETGFRVELAKQNKLGKRAWQEAAECTVLFAEFVTELSKDFENQVDIDKLARVIHELKTYGVTFPDE